MNKTTLVCAIYFASGGPSMAQEYHGGLGNFFCGPAYNMSSSLENGLATSSLLGDNLALNTATFAYGGAGYSFRPKGFVLGGSGFF